MGVTGILKWNKGFHENQTIWFGLQFKFEHQMLLFENYLNIWTTGSSLNANKSVESTDPDRERTKWTVYWKKHPHFKWTAILT